jgi:hypothetical protein
MTSQLYSLLYLQSERCNIANRDLVRHIRLNINPINSVKPQRVEHRLVVESVQIDLAIAIGEMLIMVPRRDAKRITLLPSQSGAVNLGVAGPFNDVVNGRSCLTNCWGLRSCVKPLCGCSNNAANCR